MRVLALDPGMTTGVACYNEKDSLEFSMTVPYWKMVDSNFMNKLMIISMPNKILIEDIPTNNVNRDMADLFAVITRWLKIADFKYEVIKPTEWKPFMMNERVEIPGQHARDAATMAKWWIKKNADGQR